MNGLSEAAAIRTREKYAEGFNSTMIDIWRERIALLGVVDTGALYRSVAKYSIRADGTFSELRFMFGFFEYGLFQDRGTGREVPRGNPGDIGRPKVREARPWFSKKYYSSISRLRDFMAESLGQQVVGIITDALGSP